MKDTEKHIVITTFIPLFFWH